MGSVLAVTRVLFAAAIVAGCGDDRVARGPFTASVLFEGHVWGDQLAVHDGEVLFTTYGGVTPLDHAVRGTSIATAETRAIWEGGPGELFGSGFALHDDRVVWTGEATGAVSAVLDAPISGGDRRVLVALDGLDWYAGTAADDQQLYVPGTSGAARGIFAVPFAGGAPSLVEATTSELQWIAMHGRTLYFTTQAGADTTIHRLPLDGSASSIVTTLVVSIGRGFGVTDDALYVPAADGIRRVGLDGTLLGTIETVPAGVPVSTVDAFAGDVYYVAGTTLGRVVDGEAEALVDQLHLYEGARLAADADAIYVTGFYNKGPGQVLRVVASASP